MTFFSFNSLNVNSLECVSMNNEECKIRTKITNINNNEPTFYPFSFSVNKCSGSCNNINDPHAKLSKLCVPSSIRIINVRLFNLMSRSNQTRHIEWYESCKCKSKSDPSVSNNNQRWNNEKCRCECREELIDKGRFDQGFIWNPRILIVNVINHVM